MPKEEEKKSIIQSAPVETENDDSDLKEDTKIEDDTLLPKDDDQVKRDRSRKKNDRRPARRSEKSRQEFDNKILSIRRVTRVVAGGRRFSFSIAMVIGDRRGRVGVGTGKSGDTPVAVDKAIRAAKKNMITIPLNKRGSINHPVEAKYSSAIISIMPAPGKGVIAGSAVRTVFELAGVKEVSAKILSRSKNKLNIAKATIKALLKLKK